MHKAMEWMIENENARHERELQALYHAHDLLHRVGLEFLLDTAVLTVWPEVHHDYNFHPYREYYPGNVLVKLYLPLALRPELEQAIWNVVPFEQWTRLVHTDFRGRADHTLSEPVLLRIWELRTGDYGTSYFGDKIQDVLQVVWESQGKIGQRIGHCTIGPIGKPTLRQDIGMTCGVSG